MLLNDEAPRSSNKVPSGFRAHLGTLYKTLKLKAFASFLSRVFNHPDHEREKVAVYEHKGHALLRCTIHIAPIGTSLALLILNISNYYIGGELTGTTGEDTQKLAALQVASKLLELLMLSSLATLMLTYIQRELTFGDGLPLGALLAAKEISSISFLWSSRFWGAVTFRNDKGARKRKKWMFLIPLMTMSTILGVFVGPLSATLIIPRVDDWPAGGTAFWVNGTHESLFPRRMEASASLDHCFTDTGDPSCPYGGWEMINQGYYSFWPRLEPLGSMPENVYMPGPYSVRHLTLRSRSNDSLDGFYQSIWTGANSVASVPPSVVSDGIAELARLWSFAARNFDQAKRFWSHRDVTFTVQAPTPIVQTQCTGASDFASNESATSLPIPIMNTPPDRLELCQVPHKTVTEWLAPGQSPNLLWLEDMKLKSRTNSTMNAIVTIPAAANGSSLIFTCSIDSAIPKWEVSTSRNLVKIVDGNGLGWASTAGMLPKIDLSFEWVKYLNPQISGAGNATIFSKMVSTAGIWNTTMPSHDYSYQYIVESIISTMIANGLGRASYNSSMIGHLRGYNASDPWGHSQSDSNEWVKNLLPSKHMGFNDDPDNSAYDPLSASEAAESTMFTMRATVNGYAFSAHGKAAKASIAALITYIVLAVCHIVYSWKTGWASTASDSSLEVAMLAASSRRTTRLRNTGAGTETVGIYEEMVQIRARDDRLELVFRDTEGGACRIQKNKAYG